MTLLDDFFVSAPRDQPSLSSDPASPGRSTPVAVLECITEAVYIVDRQCRFAYLNPQAEAMLRRPRAELLGVSIWAAFPEGVSTAFYDEYHRALATGVTATFEAYFAPLDTWVAVRAYPSAAGLTCFCHDISARMRAEAVLRAQYQSFPVPTYTWQLDGDDYRLVDYNLAADVVTGGKVAAFRGRPRREVYAATPDVVADFDRCRAVDAPVCRELQHRLLTTGAVRDFMVTFVPLPGDMVMVHTEDVTARRVAEAASHLQGALLAAQYEAAVDGSIVTSPTQEILSYNRRLLALWDLPDTAVTDFSPTGVLPLILERIADPAAFRARIEYLAARPDTTDCEEIALCDGRIFECHTAPVRGAAGAYYGRIWSFRDITARKVGEASLRAYEAMLVEAQRLTHLGSWDYDLATGALVWSDETYRILGLVPGGLPPTLEVFLAAVHADDRARVEGVVQGALRGEDYDLAYRIVRPDGTVRAVHARGEVIVGADGRRDRLVGAVLDVTEREALAAERAAQEQRLQALVGQLLTAQEEERRRAAYDVHDGLAQLVAGAYQCLQVYAHRHGATTPGAAANLDTALGLLRRATSEARQIINALRPTTLDDFGLVAAVRELVEGVRAAGWGVAYTASLGPARLPATVEVALFRVAQEALTNVRKHAGSGRVMVSLGWVAEGRVRLAVEDFGRGFDPSAIVCDAGPGERLGLPGMRERIALLGGCLNIDSRPAVGTRVITEVPLPRALE